MFEFVQKEHQPNAIHCKMMENERWAKYFAVCNTIGCFSELIKIVQFTSALWLITLLWNYFFLDAATNLKERKREVSTLSKLV